MAVGTKWEPRSERNVSINKSQDVPELGLVDDPVIDFVEASVGSRKALQVVADTCD